MGITSLVNVTVSAAKQKLERITQAAATIPAVKIRRKQNLKTMGFAPFDDDALNALYCWELKETRKSLLSSSAGPSDSILWCSLFKIFNSISRSNRTR